MTTEQKITGEITDALIKHSITACPRCQYPLEVPDLETEDEILSIIKEYCVIPVEGEWPSIWNGKGEVKSALTYIKELDSYRKVREIEIETHKPV